MAREQGKATCIFIFDPGSQGFFCSHTSESVWADPSRSRTGYKVVYHVGHNLLSNFYLILSYDIPGSLPLVDCITICRLLDCELKNWNYGFYQFVSSQLSSPSLVQRKGMEMWMLKLIPKKYHSFISCNLRDQKPLKLKLLKNVLNI